MKVRVGQILVYSPNALDAVDARTNLKKGDLVKVINLPGCPKANTMGHCYVGEVKTGKFIGMVHTNSLHTRKEWAELRLKLNVLLTLQLLGATKTPRHSYENMEGDGKAAFDALVESGHIVKTNDVYALSHEACRYWR